MTENPGNLNIFEGAPSRLLDALPIFSGVAGAALPIRQEAAGAAQLFTLADLDEGGQRALAAFTSEELLNPPLIRQGLAETAVLFFHAPRHDIFLFNPAHPQSRGATARLQLSRLEISLLAGFLRTAGKASRGDAARLAEAEMSMSNLHGAHYLYATAAANNPASRGRFAMCSALIELGLLQEAYDQLKADWDPEAKLLLAVIHRKTGSPGEARKILEALEHVDPLAERRAVEAAWLDLEEGKEEQAAKTFRKISNSAFDKTESLSGLGAALAKTAFRTKDKSRLAEAATALRAALVTPSPASFRIFFQLGNLYFRSGDAAQAEGCYRRSAALAPAVQALANLALTLIKTGKHAEAAAITAQVALTDLASARRLAAEFPKEKIGQFFPGAAQAPAPLPALEPAQAPLQAPAPTTAPTPAQVPESVAQQQASSGLSSAGGSFKFIDITQKISPAEPNPLAPAQPRDASVSGMKRQHEPANPPPIQFESMTETIAGSAMTEEESRKDDFISKAFRLASDMEDEFGRKIYFNIDGIGEIEKKLRMQFIKGQVSQQGNIETVRSCAAFLCYFFQERSKGRLIKMPDFDPWGWPMVFERQGAKFTTYPIQRVWRLLWEEKVPEPGWLTKYVSWVNENLKETAIPLSGVEAAKKKIMSHPEKLIDAQTEHRRMLVLLPSLEETSGIEISGTGVIKMENAIKRNFLPDIPPTSDGWRILRCYGHLLAAILAKEFKAVWYNVDGEDGGWSMRLPWKTLVFPLGKIYKTAAKRESLPEYYEALMSEKLRHPQRPNPG